MERMWVQVMEDPGGPDRHLNLVLRTWVCNFSSGGMCVKERDCLRPTVMPLERCLQQGPDHKMPTPFTFPFQGSR